MAAINGELSALLKKARIHCLDEADQLLAALKSLAAKVDVTVKPLPPMTWAHIVRLQSTQTRAGCVCKPHAFLSTHTQGDVINAVLQKTRKKAPVASSAVLGEDTV